MVDQDKVSHGEPGRHLVPVPGWDGGNADAAYLDKTLRYGEIETELDESVTGRALFGIWWRAAVASFVVFIFFFIIAVLSRSRSLGEGVGVIIGFIVFWVVLLAVRVPEPIAEWRVLLTDRAGSTTSTYSQVAGALRRRRMPIDFEVKPVDTGSRRDGVRYRLVLRENFYVAYVSVFAYGTSLYLGWMMWRTRRGGQLVWQFLVDMVGSMFGRTDPEMLMLRTERPRAMREAVHSACREGLFVAYEQRQVPIEFGFPNESERSRIPVAPRVAASPFLDLPSPAPAPYAGHPAPAGRGVPNPQFPPLAPAEPPPASAGPPAWPPPAGSPAWPPAGPGGDRPAGQ